MSAVSVVGSTGALVRRAVRGLTARGLTVATSESAADHATLAGALDAAARHPATACVLVYAHRVGSYPRFASVCQAVTPHLPVVFVPAGDFAEDSALKPWLESTGAVELRSMSEALDAIPVVGALDVPADNRCVVIGGDESLLGAAATAAKRAGFQVETRQGSTLADALGDLVNDLVVAVIEQPPDQLDQVAAAIGEARSAHPDLPLVIIADGDEAWSKSVRTFVDAGSVCVLDPTVDVAVGLRALADWERRRRIVARPPDKPRDAARLRRFVKASPDALYSPSAQAELVGALGLPSARATRAAYLEDALVAAAELGYPLRLAAVHSSMRPPDEPEWIAAGSSTELSERAESALAAKTRTLGQRAELLLTESSNGEGVTISVSAFRHDDFGVLVTVTSGRRTARFVPPGPADISALVQAIGLPSAPGPIVSALADGVSAVVGALNEIPIVDRIGVLLDVGTNGFKVRHAAISTSDA